MKRKIIGGLFALAAVSVLALSFSSTFRPIAPQAQRMSTIDVAPLNKFGFAESMAQRRAPAMHAPEPAAAAASAAVAASEATAVAADAAASPSYAAPQPQGGGAIAVSLPRIAYVYRYGFQVEGKDIAPLQRAHADLCEQQGPRNCRIISLEQSGSQGNYAQATLELDVASARARRFGTDLAKAVTAAGGSEVSTSISGEDLSKQIVDTEARLRARTLLRDRLMEVLATRKGTVAELVEAERGVAQVNEEIDEARSWLNEMQGRVEFSRVTIHYGSDDFGVQGPSQGGFVAPIREVLGSIGAIMGGVIAWLIALLAAGLPVGLFGWGLYKGWRRFRPVRSADSEGASGYTG